MSNNSGWKKSEFLKIGSRFQDHDPTRTESIKKENDEKKEKLFEELKTQGINC